MSIKASQITGSKTVYSAAFFKAAIKGEICSLLVPHEGNPLTIIDSQRASYHKISNISGTLVGNKIVDHSDVVGASPVGAAPTTSSLST